MFLKADKMITVADSIKFTSIFNDVLGPVMRGPSSSHTAGSYNIGRVALSLLGEKPDSAIFTFDPDGSYAKTYRQQAVDLAFVTGITGGELTDDGFIESIESAKSAGLNIQFKIAPLKNSNHPNTVRIDLTSKSGSGLTIQAESTGGGGFLITKVDHWNVNITGKSAEILVECPKSAEEEINRILSSAGKSIIKISRQKKDDKLLLQYQFSTIIKSKLIYEIQKIKNVSRVRSVIPVFYMRQGIELFKSSKELISYGEKNNLSTGNAGIKYESELLGMDLTITLKEMIRRLNIMELSVKNGLVEQNVKMKLLKPSAGKILNAETESNTLIGGIHTKAAAMAMAAMHISNSCGIVCAAPTGGSAGVIPGVVVAMMTEMNIDKEKMAKALFAAGSIGLIVARRATFAAEVAGCQVEIGAAGAMAAAAVVEILGGTARQASDAAAIALQNSMGSVCDLVKGMCEIPCHTRNAAAASNAFVCADLIMGGYNNPIPLDETIDAVYSVGKMLPPELRCTAMGGLAVTPSAKLLPDLR